MAFIRKLPLSRLETSDELFGFILSVLQYKLPFSFWLPLFSLPVNAMNIRYQQLSQILTEKLPMMLDPFTLACILAVIAAAIAVIFYWFSGADDERDFEKAFGENALKLLSHDREKHKSKVKIPKKKEGREKRVEPRQETDLDMDLVAPGGDSAVESLVTIPTSGSISLANTSSPERKVKKHSKKEKDFVAAATDVEEVHAEPVAPSINEAATLSEPPSEENKENRHEQTSTTESKRRKKTKTKKEEDVATSQMFAPELAQGERVGESHSSTSERSKSEKEKKPKKKIAIVNINDLDSNKVLTRIASLEEVEPEYISYLASYFHDTNAKISSLESAIVDYERKELEHKKKIDQYQQSRVISDRQIADHVRVISELTSKLQALSVSEAAAKQQIMQLNNVCVENDTLKSALSKSAADAAAAAKAISNLESMKVSNAELTDRLAKMNKSLNETVEQNAALKREIAEFAKQTAALEHLKQEFATLDTAARQLKAELEDKTRVIDETKLMVSNVDSVKKAECERDEVAHQFAQARSEWEQVKLLHRFFIHI
ncbi:putative molybdenum cofactor biosynthesis protein [Trichostrongylus colubriformis]|uniref:Molybdenum cofactor biosynthesis protein n=1 Tax=Trichostrongylus colubriformis TaxID=6319 RepID=A0AAN8IK17_TRICO